MRKIVFIFSLLYLSFFFSPYTFALDKGDNCDIDLTHEYQDTDSWEDAYMVRGDDGSLWRRALISYPSEEFILKEGESSDIRGIAEPFRDVQVYLFSPQDNGNGGTKRPDSSGICLYAGTSDEIGNYSLPINARILWGNIDSDIIIDAYFRMEENEKPGETGDTSQEFFVGVNQSFLTTHVDIVPEVSEENTQYICESNKGTPYIFVLALELSPSSFPSKYAGDNFNSVSDDLTFIRFFHTFLGSEEGNPNLDPDVGARISLKAVVLETIKRALLGESTATVSGRYYAVNGPLNERSLEDAASNGNELVIAIENMLSTSGIRDDGAVFLLDFITAVKSEHNAAAGGLGFSPFPETTVFYKELFPDSAETDDWAKAFLEILDLWTKSPNINNDLLENDSMLGWNYLPADLRNWISSCEGFTYIHGISPRILLHTSDEIFLEPNFSDIQMVYSEREFDASTNGWFFSEGKKSPLYYHYIPTKSLVPELLEETACVKKHDAQELVETFGSDLGLTREEQEILLQELSPLLSSYEYSLLTFADPKSIRDRFSWRGDGADLRIDQLFFRGEIKGCAEKYIPHFSEPLFSEEREGFEVGIFH
jgi:hypothetical protein